MSAGPSAAHALTRLRWLQGPEHHVSDGLGGKPVGLAERVDEWALAMDRWRSRPVAAAAAVVLAVAIAGVGWWLGRSPAPPPAEDLIPQVSVASTTSTTGGPVPVVVHVAGAVVTPGVYVLDDHSRVTDAVIAAGGFTADADPDQLNLAALLMDGAQVRVPAEGEVLVPLPSLGGGGGAAAGTAGPIDLNRATADELDTLPGVGPSTAAAIIAFRDDNGPFTSVDGLLDVPGIGPAKLAALADSVIIR